MSTPPKRDAKAAAKRRAEARRRNREIGRHLFAYGIIAILVIGTVSTVLIPSVGAPTPTPATATPASQGLDQLLTQADGAATVGDWVTAVGLYQAYLAQLQLSQTPAPADVHLKLAKAFINSSPPDYVKASVSLQEAIRIAGEGSAIATEAQQLLTDNASKIATAVAVATAATATATVAITGTATLNATSVPLTTATATISGIGPVPIVPTVSTPGASTDTAATSTPGASPTR